MVLLHAKPFQQRFRKQLLVVVIFVIIITLLFFQGSLNSPIQKTIDQIIPSNAKTNASLHEPEHQPPKLPDVSELLDKAPAWAASKQSNPDFNITQSILIRQGIGRDLDDLFKTYRPPISAINSSYLKNWPQMPPFQLNKEYVVDEVITASGGFFLKDEDHGDFRAQQQSLLEAIPQWSQVSKGYSGRGIVISAGSIHLERIWPNTILMIKSLNCTLPIEVWTKDQEEYNRTLPLAEQIRTELKMQISVHTITDYIPVVFHYLDIPGVFKIKPLSLVFSTFEEVILLDSDSIPVMDPNILFESEAAKTGLVQFPDFWSNSVSKVMHDVYDFDYNMTRTVESGQMLINKNLQFDSLIMATYFNWWGPDFFHKLIYLDSMGAGDKDTFYMGAAACHRDYHVSERNVELIRAKKADGSLWKEDPGLLNGAMGQFNPSNTSEIFFMHFHGPKINMQAEELAGQFDIQFFAPDKAQNVSFRMGNKWLETRLWENLKWVECESTLKNLTTSACEGVTKRVESMV